MSTTNVNSFLFNTIFVPFNFKNHSMKFLPYFAFLLSTLAIAQPNTDVYLLDLERTDSTFTVSNLETISKSDGYDNQPAFLDNDRLLYAGSENGQTEIQLYNISENTLHRVNATTLGGEYSPMPYPNRDKITAVRLDTTGLQRLYAYDYANLGFGDYKMLLSELEIAYYAFYDENTVVASILSGGQLDLVIADIKRDEATLYAENAGRSIHNVPESPMVSYTIVNEEKNNDVYVVDVKKPEETYFVSQLPTGIQDHTWLDANTLLLGSGSKLYTYSLFGPEKWVQVADLSAHNIKDITRIAVSPDGKHLAFAAEPSKPSPGDIVDAHIAPFNEGKLDEFANAFAKDVVVNRFPGNLMYIGRAKLKENYNRFFKNNNSWNVEVRDRIIWNDYVIDEEIAFVNGNQNRQVTIYKTQNERIQSMTFIGNKRAEDPLPAVNALVNAYNNRDIDAFAAVFSEDVQMYEYPNELQLKGKAALYNEVTPLFQNTPNLNYTVTKRMVLGPTVVDEVRFTTNEGQRTIIAIYELRDGKIWEVTFLR